MRKFGLIAAIVGIGILAVGLLLRVLANLNTWLWLPGAALLAVGGASVPMGPHGQDRAAVMPIPKSTAVAGTDTARLLDNFEQRFAELKGRKPNATVLGDLYTLGNQLEQRGRVQQATAVYRHLARFDNTYQRRRRAIAPPHGRRAGQAQGGDHGEQGALSGGRRCDHPEPARCPDRQNAGVRA